MLVSRIVCSLWLCSVVMVVVVEFLRVLVIVRVVWMILLIDIKMIVLFWDLLFRCVDIRVVLW